MKEDVRKYIERDYARNNTNQPEEVKTELRVCNCGIPHLGYYGDRCAVCVALERAGQLETNRQVEVSLFEQAA